MISSYLSRSVLHKNTLNKAIRCLFSNQGNKDNKEIEKSSFRGGVDPSEAYMEEPKRVGMSYEEYAKKKKDADEIKKAIEVTTIKSQIKDESVPYKASDSERDFHRKMTLDIAQFKLSKP